MGQLSGVRSVWQVDRETVSTPSGASLALTPQLDGYELSVTITVQTSAWDHWDTHGGLEIVPSSARLSLRTKGPEVDLGMILADPQTSFVVQRHQTAETVIYRTHLSRLALHRFEAQRDGAAINFELWANARAFVGGGQQGRRGALVSEPLTFRYFGKVGADAWHEMVQTVGATSSIIVEIPVPSAADFPELAAALGHLRAALDQRARGDSAIAVSTSRLALDELGYAGFGGHAPPEVLAFLQNSAKRMTLSERFSMVQAALNLALSPAAHGGANRADLGAFDAKFAVTSVAALLALAPYRGRRPPEPAPDVADAQPHKAQKPEGP